MNPLVATSVLMCAFVFAQLLLWRLRRRREARQLVATLEGLFSHASAAVVAWRPGRGIVLWNSGAEALFGFPSEKMLEAPLPQGLVSLQQTAPANPGNWHGHIELQSADGSAVNAMVCLVRNDALVVAVIEDASRGTCSAQMARAQRDALVREVHHRIKNSLQGVAGLLRQHLSDKPLLKPLLEAASAQVSTIAAVHGLQGESKGGEINLRMLVARVAASISGIMHVPIVLSESCGVLDGFTVSEEESVPVAMVLNELIVNAVKHRLQSGTHSAVAIEGIARVQHAEILISNPGFLPANFNFRTGAHIGNGLGLIHSLLPRRGATIDLAEEGGRVVATLTLRAPDVLFTRKTQEIPA